jgi:hypothetical protein
LNKTRKLLLRKLSFYLIETFSGSNDHNSLVKGMHT